MEDERPGPRKRLRQAGDLGGGWEHTSPPKGKPSPLKKSTSTFADLVKRRELMKDEIQWLNKAKKGKEDKERPAGKASNKAVGGEVANTRSPVKTKVQRKEQFKRKKS